jgi:hypothetical protein
MGINNKGILINNISFMIFYTRVYKFFEQKHGTVKARSVFLTKGISYIIFGVQSKENLSSYKLKIYIKGGRRDGIWIAIV